MPMNLPRRDANGLGGRFCLLLLLALSLLPGALAAAECGESKWKNKEDDNVGVRMRVRNQSSSPYWFTTTVDGKTKQVTGSDLTTFREDYYPTTFEGENFSGSFEIENVDTEESGTCRVYFTVKKVKRENPMGGEETWRRIRINSGNCRIDDSEGDDDGVVEAKVECERDWKDDQSVYVVRYTILDK